MTPYIPITSDGKEPDLAPFVGAIIQAAGKAVRKERGAGASGVSQKDVVFDRVGPRRNAVRPGQPGQPLVNERWQGIETTTVEPPGR
jgi:hypothetical protein